jgi:hypothetical protein
LSLNFALEVFLKISAVADHFKGGGVNADQLGKTPNTQNCMQVSIKVKFICWADGWYGSGGAC